MEISELENEFSRLALQAAAEINKYFSDGDIDAPDYAKMILKKYSQHIGSLILSTLEAEIRVLVKQRVRKIVIETFDRFIEGEPS